MSLSFYILEPGPGESRMSFLSKVRQLDIRLPDLVIAKNVRPDPERGYTVITKGPVAESDQSLLGLKPGP